MKTASFTVRATERQSLRWKRAADAEGHRSVGTWIAEALDRHLDALQRAGKPLPLGWRKGAAFTVSTPHHGELRVSGLVSHPFGYYRGTDAGADRYSDFYTLVFTPDGRIIATLRSAAQCRTLAAELARVWVHWGGEKPAEDPAPLLQRFQRQLAPDGRAVTLVSLTAGPAEHRKVVSVTRTSGNALAAEPVGVAEIEEFLETGRVVVKGTLAWADSIKKRKTRYIKIEQADGTPHKIAVAGDIMHDVVSPYYEQEVEAVVGINKKGKYYLIHIGPA